MTNNTLVCGLVLVLTGLISYSYLNGWKAQIQTCQSMPASEIAANEVTNKCNILESQGTAVYLAIGLGIGLGLLGCVFASAGAVMWYRNERKETVNV